MTQPDPLRELQMRELARQAERELRRRPWRCLIAGRDHMAAGAVALLEPVGLVLAVGAAGALGALALLAPWPGL